MLRPAALVVILAAVAACSGGGDAAPIATVPPTSEAPPTSPPSSVTTEPPVPETTPAPTTTESPPTTEPPAETITPTTFERELTPDEQAVIDAAIAAWSAWNGALLAPNNDDAIRELRATHTGDALDRVANEIAELRIRNVKSVTNYDLPAYIDPIERSVSVDLNARSATVEYCHLDSNTAVEVGGKADGSDLILDDLVSIRFEREEFHLVDGQWMKAGGESLSREPGVTECPDL